MKKVSIDNLPAHRSLDEHLFSEHGIQLIPAGTTMSEDILDHLSQVGLEFFIARDVREIADTGPMTEVDPQSINAQHRVSPDLVSIGGRRLCDAAEYLDVIQEETASFGLFKMAEPEPGHLARFRQALTQVIVEASMTDLDALDESELLAGRQIEFKAPSGAGWPDSNAIMIWREERIKRIRSQFARLLAGLPAELSVFDQMIDELLDLLRRNAVRFPQIALLCPARTDYLPDHALSTAALAIAVGARQNYSESGLRIAGLTGLLHDVGMLLVPDRIRTGSDTSLSEEDRRRISQHPMYSVYLFNEIEGLPDIVRWASYRHHERDDGSGYPLGLKRAAIGTLPRMLAMCDVATAMIGNRPFRSDMLPHDAIHELVELGRASKLNRADIRSLVDCVGLYPIGSYVRLSTGEGAQVVGNHPGSPDRPVVRVCDRMGHASRREVDLLSVEPHQTSILRGIPRSEAARRVFHNHDESVRAH